MPTVRPIFPASYHRTTKIKDHPVFGQTSASPIYDFGYGERYLRLDEACYYLRQNTGPTERSIAGALKDNSRDPKDPRCNVFAIGKIPTDVHRKVNYYSTDDLDRLVQFFKQDQLDKELKRERQETQKGIAEDWVSFIAGSQHDADETAAMLYGFSP